MSPAVPAAPCPCAVPQIYVHMITTLCFALKEHSLFCHIGSVYDPGIVSYAARHTALTWTTYPTYRVQTMAVCVARPPHARARPPDSHRSTAPPPLTQQCAHRCRVSHVSHVTTSAGRANRLRKCRGGSLQYQRIQCIALCRVLASGVTTVYRAIHT